MLVSFRFDTSPFFKGKPSYNRTELSQRILALLVITTIRITATGVAATGRSGSLAPCHELGMPQLVLLLNSLKNMTYPRFS